VEAKRPIAIESSPLATCAYLVDDLSDDLPADLPADDATS
jgi:hypothetical protein